MRHQFEEDLQKIKHLLKDEEVAKELYRALCNMQWVNIADSTKIYSCSWRYAGGIVSNLRNQGESYLDFYCSGNEGHVTPHIEAVLREIGWVQYPYKEDE